MGYDTKYSILTNKPLFCGFSVNEASLLSFRNDAASWVFLRNSRVRNILYCISTQRLYLKGSDSWSCSCVIQIRDSRKFPSTFFSSRSSFTLSAFPLRSPGNILTQDTAGETSSRPHWWTPQSGLALEPNFTRERLFARALAGSRFDLSLITKGPEARRRVGQAV